MRWIAAVCLAGLVASTQGGTYRTEGSIVGITDGDTITLLDTEHHQHKIHLDGIDAPESKQPCGNASKRSLPDLTFNREAVAECHMTDRRGREV